MPSGSPWRTLLTAAYYTQTGLPSFCTCCYQSQGTGFWVALPSCLATLSALHCTISTAALHGASSTPSPFSLFCSPLSSLSLSLPPPPSIAENIRLQTARVLLGISEEEKIRPPIGWTVNVIRPVVAGDWWISMTSLQL